MSLLLAECELCSQKSRHTPAERVFEGQPLCGFHLEAVRYEKKIQEKKNKREKKGEKNHE